MEFSLQNFGENPTTKQLDALRSLTKDDYERGVERLKASPLHKELAPSKEFESFHFA